MNKSLATLLAALLFLAPLSSSAQSVAELQAQLAQLMQLLAALQGGAVTPSVPQTTDLSCVRLSRNLGPDDEDAFTAGDVSRLQRFLANNPAWYPEGRVTGFYGPLTVRAVQRYQASRGIVSYGTPDTTGYGRVGTRTRDFLAANCTGLPSVPSPTPMPSPNPVPQPPSPSPLQPLTGSITVDFRLNQYYEARGNGFYVQIVSLGTNTAVIEVGTPRCGTPSWPSGTGNASACQAIGSKRQVSLNVGAPVNVPIDSTAVTLQLVQIVNGVARLIISPGTPVSPTPNIPTTSSITCNLVSDKSYVTLNEAVTLTWGSTNATSARWVQGPFIGTSIGLSGSATLSSLTETKPFTIEFANGTGTKTCSVNVNVRGEPSINVSLPASGQRIGRGQMLAIAWESRDVPLNARVRLELYSASTSMVVGNNDRGILSAAPANGSYQWQIPSSTAQVVSNTGFITGLADGLYRIVAKLYTGDTCWGGCVPSSRTNYANGSSAVFTVGPAPTTTPTYSQSAYYSQGTYYSQTSYYGQGGYTGSK